MIELPCKGCKYLVHGPSVELCKIDDGPWEWQEDPYTGRRTYRVVAGKSPFRPTVSEMRAPGAKCGPDRVLYEPILFRRLLAKLRGSKNDNQS